MARSCSGKLDRAAAARSHICTPLEKEEKFAASDWLGRPSAKIFSRRLNASLFSIFTFSQKQEITVSTSQLTLIRLTVSSGGIASITNPFVNTALILFRRIRDRTFCIDDKRVDSNLNDQYDVQREHIYARRVWYLTSHSMSQGGYQSCLLVSRRQSHNSVSRSNLKAVQAR